MIKTQNIIETEKNVGIFNLCKWFSKNYFFYSLQHKEQKDGSQPWLDPIDLLVISGAFINVIIIIF